MVLFSRKGLDVRFFSLVFVLLVFASASTFELADNKQLYSISSYAKLYVDKNSTLTIEDMLKNKVLFRPTSKEVLYFHFSKATYWFALSIKNPFKTQKSYRLEIPVAWLDEVSFFTINPDGSFTIQKSGDHVAFKQKRIKTRDNVFSVLLRPGINEFFIKVRSKDALQLSMLLMSQDSFQKNSVQVDLFFGFLSGILIMMLLYAVFYFFTLKDYLYSIYIGYILSFLLMTMATQGYVLFFIWPDHFEFNEWMYELSFISYLAFMVWFAKRFLHVKAFSQFWDKILTYILYIHALLILFSIFLPYATVMEWGVYSGAITPFVLIVPAILSLKQHKSWTKFYIIGWMINMLFYTLWALSFFGVLPYHLLLSNANVLGILFELMIFSLGMVFRLDYLVKSHNKLSSEINTDALTQVANRYAFNREFPKLVKTAYQNRQELFFAMLDIDDFKEYNDTYGHPQGDKALIQVAHVLKRSMKRSCDKVYRLGGEEFALVLCESSIQKAYAHLQEIQKELEKEPIVLKNRALTLSFGLLGVSFYEELSYTEVYKEADELLYRAKKEGKNRIVFKHKGQ